MPDRPNNLIKILPVLILGVILSGSVVLVGIRQLYLSKAGITGQIARVDTQPAGDIVVSPNGKPVYLSALAYDNNGEPIFSGVIYQWGLSSSGSLGSLTANNEIATFMPGATSGSGDLWVQAFNTQGQGMKSQKIYVGITPPTPTPTPKPDLIIDSISLERISLGTGTDCPAYKYTVLVKNIGDAPASKSYVKTTISPTQPQAVNNCQSYAPYNGSTAPIPANDLVSGDYLYPQQSERYYDYFNPSQVGTITISATADYFGSVDESNESNNTSSYPFSVLAIIPTPTPTLPPYIQVLTPNGGEQLTVGQSYTIQWQSSPGIATYLIYLENSLGQISLINGVSAPNTSYTWRVDSPIMQNTLLHKIKIMDGSQGGSDYQSATQDQSDNFFTIVVPGDANGDGKVDGVDYVIWLGHYGQTSTRGSSVGDFNTDTYIDGVDYIIWLNHYGQ